MEEKEKKKTKNLEAHQTLQRKGKKKKRKTHGSKKKKRQNESQATKPFTGRKEKTQKKRRPKRKINKKKGGTVLPQESECGGWRGLEATVKKRDWWGGGKKRLGVWGRGEPTNSPSPLTWRMTRKTYRFGVLHRLN